MSYYTVTICQIPQQQLPHITVKSFVNDTNAAFNQFISEFQLSRIGSSCSAEIEIPPNGVYVNLIDILKDFSRKYPIVYLKLEEHAQEGDNLEDLWLTYVTRGKSQTHEAVVTVSFPEFNIDEIE